MLTESNSTKLYEEIDILKIISKHSEFQISDKNLNQIISASCKFYY